MQKTEVIEMVPSKDKSPRAAGLFGQLVSIAKPRRNACDIRNVPDPESYRKALLRSAVAFTTGCRQD